MLILPLVVVSLLAQDELSPPQVCDDDFASCKETCTMHHGTSFKRREKLVKCMSKCKHTHDGCLDRFMEVRRNELEAKQKEDYAVRTGSGSARYPTDRPNPAPKPDPTEPAPVPRTATRGSELGPAVDREPDPYPAAAQKRTDPPKAAAAKAQPTDPSKPPPPATAPTPEREKPKKKDLSEWDPNDLK